MAHLLVLYLGSLMLRSCGIAVIAGICSLKVRNVAVRHAIWTAVLGAMLLMPIFDYFLPATWIPARMQQITAKPAGTFRMVSIPSTDTPKHFAPSAQAEGAPTIQTTPLDWWKGVTALYALVAIAMLIRLAMGYRGIWRLKRTGKTIVSAAWDEIVASHRPGRRIPSLQESEAVHVPMTIGFLRPVVILPLEWKTWDDWKLRAALLHEFAHVRRADWGIAAGAAIAKCIYWMNPLSWFLERRLSELAEQASDDASMLRRESATRYAEILLEFAAAAQDGGRYMRRGVAMAQHKIKGRIERVLNNPPSGTGILKIAGWMLVLIVAAPVIYSASALQVASEPKAAPTPRYTAVLGEFPSYQAASVGQPPVPKSVPKAVRPTEPDTSSPAALQDLFQLELAKQRIQYSYEATHQKLLELQQGNQENPAAAQISVSSAGTDLSNEADLRRELERLQNQMRELTQRMLILQAEKAATTATEAIGTALLDLPDNADDLRAYLEQLARLRGHADNDSFLVSFDGVQGRTVSMKVAGQEINFGCASCSFFVGESVVSSAPSMSAGPGILVRLSSDGNDLSITCRASLCNVQVEGESASFPSGSSESFRTSKILAVVISKY